MRVMLMPLLVVLAGFLLVSCLGLLMSWETLSKRFNRRKNVKKSVLGTVTWCNRIWVAAHDQASVERRRGIREPVVRLLLKRLYDDAGKICSEMKLAAREAKHLPLEGAEKAVVRLSEKALELESTVGRISSVAQSAYELRERTLDLLDSADLYRISLLPRIDAQLGRGVGLDKERRLVMRFGNLIEAYRACVNASAVDVLHRTAGMLIVLNTVHGQVLKAENGRPICRKSYRQDRTAMKERVIMSDLVPRPNGDPAAAMDWSGIRFTLDFLAAQAGVMGRRAELLAALATPTGVFGAAATSDTRGFQRRAALTRVCIKGFAASI